MKNENIRKINTLGKVSRILLIIMRVVFIIGIVACLIVSVAFLAVPKTDVITADGTVSAQIKVDCEQLPPFFSDDLGINENDIDFDAFGTGIKWLVEENEIDGDLIYDINGELDIDNSRSVILGVSGTMAVSAVLCAVMLVVVIFGGKLAKALEVCNSPFEENVLKAMKNFAFSFIPVAVLEILLNGIMSLISLTTAFIVIVVIMFALIFNYGAELQKESDETL